MYKEEIGKQAKRFFYMGLVCIVVMTILSIYYIETTNRKVCGVEQKIKELTEFKENVEKKFAIDYGASVQINAAIMDLRGDVETIKEYIDTQNR